MNEENITNLILSVQQYPKLVLFLVFLTAFTESLVIVGLIIPGTVFMIVFGTLIALDALAFWPAVLLAILGAVAGDSLSYWLGHRYQNRIATIWPLSKHPQLMDRANYFFSKHGIKSIIFSRFVGPVRPIIPAIAGMTKMPMKIFLAANITSAIFWAPIYLLPGILFGLSIDIASEFAGKFIVLIVMLLCIVLFSLWAIQKIYLYLKPYNEKLISKLLNWSQKHPIAGQMPAAVFDSSHTEIKGLTLLASLLLVITAFFFFLNKIIIFPYNFDSIDRLVYYSLQTLRSPPFDGFMLWLAYISSSTFIALLSFSFGFLFILKHKFLALWHWLGAIFLPVLLSPFITNDLVAIFQENINAGFHSLPSIVIISVIGFSTILISSGLSSTLQKILYYCSATIILFVSLSQLYFSFQVFSQILYGILIGTLWFSILGIAYYRHATVLTEKKFKKEKIIILLLLLIFPSWALLKQPILYNPTEKFYLMGKNAWQESGWTMLPVNRQDIYSNKTALFNIQWAAYEKDIRTYLIRNDFVSVKNTTKKLANWFIQDTNVSQLPILPHIHKGEYERLRFHQLDKNGNKLVVIRLWKSTYQLKQDSLQVPLWFGDISYMQVKNKLGLKYLITSKEILETLPENIKGGFNVVERNSEDLKNNKTYKLFLIH